MADDGSGFVPFRLRGGRYEQVGFPLEALPELTRYERLLLDVARSLWRTDHPNRLRLPRGFAARLQLRLVRVDEGSVVPVMNRPGIQDETPALFDENVSIFERSKNLIDDTFAAIVADRELPPELPEEVVPEFLRFGSSLRENEQIEFARNGLQTVYDRAARKRFLLRTATEKFSVEGIELGRVTQLDADSQEFSLTDLHGHVIRGRYSNSSLTPDFRKVLDSRNLAEVVRLEGALSVNENDVTLEVEDVWGVEVFELSDSPWSTRLLELAQLKAGWLDGNGCPVSFAALDFARDLLRELTERSSSVPLPGIFPMPDGGVQLEWQDPTKNLVYSAEVSPELQITLYRLNTKTDEEEEDLTASLRKTIDFLMGSIGEQARA